MNARIALVAAALLGLLCARSSHALPADSTAVRPSFPIEGAYQDHTGAASLTVQRLVGDFLYLSCTQGWEGVGILQGNEYEGVFREPGLGKSPAAMGRHVIYWRDDGGLEVHTTYSGSDAGTVERWHRLSEDRGAAADSSRDSPGNQEPELPRFGEYVYVEELPEAITKVPPIYPELGGRKDGVQGTVIVQALVLTDGTVGATKIVKSIPVLDQAAVAAVRQWRFKPAMSKGRPVKVWVAVPVKFSLH